LNVLSILDTWIELPSIFLVDIFLLFLVQDIMIVNLSCVFHKCKCCHLKVFLVHTFDVSIMPCLVFEVLSFIDDTF
jgi:hypothetical protein